MLPSNSLSSKHVAEASSSRCLLQRLLNQGTERLPATETVPTLVVEAIVYGRGGGTGLANLAAGIMGLIWTFFSW